MIKTHPFTPHPLPLTLLFLFLAACAIPQVPSRIIYEDSTNFVRLEHDEEVTDIPTTRHSHPVILPVEQMSSLLGGLSIQEHRIWIQQMIFGPAPVEAVFTPQEIALLAPRLTEALARANANERVVFYLSHPQSSIKREVTSGGLYVKGNQLHFILGNHRIVYGIPAYGMVYDRRYPMLPTGPKAFDLRFSVPDAIIKQRAGLWSRFWGRAKDEIVINLQKIYGPALPEPSAAPAL